MAESFCTMQEPLTPEDCDLRGYDFMPLYGNRYFKSSSYMHAASENPRAGMAAMKLWWEAWYQVPCGSLPDDDIELAMLADFGTDKRGWAKAKEIALRGFVKCSDGRLYHKELCEIALDKGRWDDVRKELQRTELRSYCSYWWKELRNKVFIRDNFTCTYCGSSDLKLECDHVTPVALGGLHTIENLTTACVACNRSKGAKPLESWLKEIEGEN